jgi:hypothetical protein
MEKTQINKVTDGKGDITTVTNEIQKIMWEYFENLYSRKLKNRAEKNQEDINNLNRSIKTVLKRKKKTF